MTVDTACRGRSNTKASIAQDAATAAVTCAASAADVACGDGKSAEETDVAVTYTVKLLKRGRGATEKAKFLLGSDDKLYACLDGEVAGAMVGERALTAEGKKRGFRFIKGV